MRPVLFKIGFFVIYSYGTMLAIAFIVSILLVFPRLKTQGLKEDSIISLSFYVVISGILGARILYVLFNIRDYLSRPFEILMIHHGGLAFYGGFIAGIFCVILYLKSTRIPVLQTLDTLAPYIALGQSIARIGCLLNGCCYGKPVHSGSGFIFRPESVAGVQFPGEILYPTQLYSSFANLAIFFILLVWSNFKKKKGEIFAGYLLLYSIKRFLIEFLRGDSPRLFFGLTSFQIISLAIGIIALFLLVRWKVSLE